MFKNEYLYFTAYILLFVVLILPHYTFIRQTLLSNMRRHFQFSLELHFSCFPISAILSSTFLEKINYFGNKLTIKLNVRKFDRIRHLSITTFQLSKKLPSFRNMSTPQNISIGTKYTP